MSAQRVVSLVPSITEALASVRPGAIVGATDWCSHPKDLHVVRVRGTKNPNLDTIIELRPDVVIANKEENREIDVVRLREAGLPVWVSQIESVPEAIAAFDELFEHVVAWPRPGWVDDARREWLGPLPEPVGTLVVPVWRDPWMVIGLSNYANDLLRRLGRVNVFADPTLNPNQRRYPCAELREIDSCGADEIWLPDEPYPFGPDDGIDAFAQTPTRLVSGRLLTWYGPALTEARSLAD